MHFELHLAFPSMVPSHWLCDLTRAYDDIHNMRFFARVAAQKAFFNLSVRLTFMTPEVERDAVYD